MRIRECIKMAFSDLNRRKKRTFLTTFGISIATLLIVTMVGLGSGANDFIRTLFSNDEFSRTISIEPVKNISNDEMISKESEGKSSEIEHYITKDTLKQFKSITNVDSVKAEITSQCSEIEYNGKRYKGEMYITGFNKGASIFSNTEIESVKNSKNDKNLEVQKAGDISIETKGNIVISEYMVNDLRETPEKIIGKEITIIAYTEGIKQPKEYKFKVSGVIDKNFDKYLSIYMLDEDAASIKGFIENQKDYMNQRGYDYCNILAKTTDDVSSIAYKVRDNDYKEMTAEEYN